MKRKYLLLWVFMMLFVIRTVVAQNGYTIEHYTSENGLPQNSVKSIAADSEGFIWLATEDGLVRFDGHRFYIFNSSNLDVRDNRVFYLQHVLRDPVQVGSGRNKLIYAFFQKYEVRIENGIAISDTVYYGQTDRKRKRLINDTALEYLSAGIPSMYNLMIPEARTIILAGSDDGDFYVCETLSVSYYQSWKKKYTISFHVKDTRNFFSLGNQLYQFIDVGQIKEVYRNEIKNRSVSGDILKHPFYDQKKASVKIFWNPSADQAFFYLDKSLYRLKPCKDGEFDTTLMIEDFDLLARGIEQIYYDNLSEVFFFGSITQGLFVLKKKHFQTLNINGNTRSNSLYAQVPFENNAVLTPTGNVIGKDSLTGRTIDIHIPIVENVNTFDKYGIIRDRNSGTWIKNGPKLLLYDYGLSKLLKVWTFSDEIKSLHRSKSGEIWLGLLGKGLYRIDPKDRRFTATPFLQSNITGCVAIESLSNNKLLIGTTTGLYIFEVSSKIVRLVRGTAGLSIKSIHAFNGNKAWILAQKKGLMLLDEHDNIVGFPLDKNKYLASPHCVISDRLGYLWIPTNRGLFQIFSKDLLEYARLKNSEGSCQSKILTKLPTELFYMYHTMDEGFNTNEFNGSCHPCFARLANGNVSLPSIDGLVWFKPEKLKSYLPTGGIIVDKAESNQKAMKISGDTLRLPLSPTNIRINFSTAYLGNDYNLNLSYKVIRQGDDGDSEGWLPFENGDLTIRYPSLSSGKYIILVRKLSGFGINNYIIKRLHLIVPQHWYETAWAMFIFIFTFVICLICIIYFYGNYRLAAAARENKKLEEVIVQRTASLNQALLNVEQSKTEMGKQMHLLSRLVTSITHDIQSPLKYIGFATRRIPGMIENNQLQKASSLGITISELSDRMTGMLGDLLGYIKVQVYGNRLSFEEISLKKLVDDKLELFKDTIHLNGSSFVNDVGSEQTVYSDYQFLAIIIHNLIDNAAKYTYEGKIGIYCVSSENDKLELVISNTGTGISSELLDLVNTPIGDKSLKELLENGRVTGLGLLMVKEMAELASIRIKVIQTEVTSFHLFFNRKP